MVCQPVNLHFPGRDFLLPGRTEFLHLQPGGAEVFPGQAEHGPQQIIPALQRQGGCGKENGVQGFDQLAVRIFFFLFFPDDPAAPSPA